MLLDMSRFTGWPGRFVYTGTRLAAWLSYGSVLGGMVVCVLAWLHMVRSARLAVLWGALFLVVTLAVIYDITTRNSGGSPAYTFAAVALLCVPIAAQVWVAGEAQRTRPCAPDDAAAPRLRLLHLAPPASIVVTLVAATVVAWGPARAFDDDMWRELRAVHLGGPLGSMAPGGDNRRARMLGDLLQRHLRIGMSQAEAKALLGDAGAEGDDLAYYDLLHQPNLAQQFYSLVRWGTVYPYLRVEFEHGVLSRVSVEG